MHSLWGILLFENFCAALCKAVEPGEALSVHCQGNAWFSGLCRFHLIFFYFPGGKERQLPLNVGISQQTLNPYCLTHVERLICSCCLALPKRPVGW